MKPPTFMECTVCGREFGSKSITIHERQCLQKLRRTEIIDDRDSGTNSGNNLHEKLKKKRIPSVSSITKTTASERIPVFQSPTPPPPTLLPKIQNEIGKRAKQCSAIRPTTATLSKPKILNIEYIKHDMSLMRLDYSEAQLRLNDDENHNFSSNRYNFMFPTVSSTGIKSKIPSPPKSIYERGLVKLPDSTLAKNSNEPKKQNSTDSSILLVLPTPDLPKYTSDIDPVKKSLSFPLLPSQISSAFLLKQLKSTENPFPRITNDRSTVQSSSNYFLTPTSRPQLPGQCAEECRRLVREDQLCAFYPNSQAEISRAGTNEDLESFDIPKVIYIRDNMDTFASISEQSLVAPSENSFESLEMESVKYYNIHSNISTCEVTDAKITVEGENTSRRTLEKDIQDSEDDTATESENSKEHQSKASSVDRKNSDLTACSRVFAQQRMEQRSFLPSVTATPLFVNIPIASASASADSGHWLFGSQDAFPKSILKCNSRSSESSSIESFEVRNQLRAGASSGSDCDNEGTSSGYGLFRNVVSSRTILRKRRDTVLQGASFTAIPSPSPPPPQEIIPIDTPSPLMSMTPSRTEALVDQLMNTSRLKLTSQDRKPRFRFSKLTTYEKVSTWLENCSNINSHTPEGDPGWAADAFAVEEPKIEAAKPPLKSINNKNCTREQVQNSMKKITKEESGMTEDPNGIISGLVTVTFKVQDAGETRTYNFVKKMHKKKNVRVPNVEFGAQEKPFTEVKGPRVPLTHKDTPLMSTTSEALFRRYAPPKCLQGDKQIIKLLANIQSSHVLKRPKTAPIPSTCLNSSTNQSVKPLKARKPPNDVKANGSYKFANSKVTKVNCSETVPGPAKVSRTLPTAATRPPVAMSPPGTGITSSPNRALLLKRRSPTTHEQSRTLIWTRPISQRQDKSSQVPETRSTFVQYSFV